MTDRAEKKSLVTSMAQRYDMGSAEFVNTIKATCLPSNASDAQFASFLMVAKEYNLNPLTKEIYAFPSKGGIQPIVSIDGWMKMINSHPDFDGLEFKDQFDDGKLVAVTAKIYRKDRSHPVEVTEYMSECKRNTDPWKQWPARMLRHKATIQAARYAFSFSGIMEQDEFDRMPAAEKDITPPAPEGKGVSGLKSKVIDQEPVEVVDEETGEVISEVKDEAGNAPSLDEAPF